MAGVQQLVKVIIFACAVLFMSSKCMTSVTAQVHHVVGDDRGWDILSDIPSWLAGRTFRVDDTLWFAYSAAHGSIAELKSREDFESCNVDNPIRMYIDGLDKVRLDGQGVRYFASTNARSCKSGLKLHVEVLPEGPQMKPEIPRQSERSASIVAAAGPMTPSGSCHLSEYSKLFLIALSLSFSGLVYSFKC